MNKTDCMPQQVHSIKPATFQLPFNTYLHEILYFIKLFTAEILITCTGKSQLVKMSCSENGFYNIQYTEKDCNQWKYSMYSSENTCNL